MQSILVVLVNPNFAPKKTRLLIEPGLGDQTEASEEDALLSRFVALTLRCTHGRSLAVFRVVLKLLEPIAQNVIANQTLNLVLVLMLGSRLVCPHCCSTVDECCSYSCRFRSKN